MSTAAMALCSLCPILARQPSLQTLDVGDDLTDLGVADLPPEGRHDRAEARDDLRLRVEDRLADVVLVDVDLPDVGRFVLGPHALPGRPDAGRASRRVAREA